MTDSIVVYRSKREQMFDEWWWDAIESNPESFMTFVHVFAGLLILLAACCVVKNMMRRRKLKSWRDYLP